MDNQPPIYTVFPDGRLIINVFLVRRIRLCYVCETLNLVIHYIAPSLSLLPPPPTHTHKRAHDSRVSLSRPRIIPSEDVSSNERGRESGVLLPERERESSETLFRRITHTQRERERERERERCFTLRERERELRNFS